MALQTALAKGGHLAGVLPSVPGPPQSLVPVCEGVLRRGIRRAASMDASQGRGQSESSGEDLKDRPEGSTGVDPSKSESVGVCVGVCVWPHPH
jgi:hypothetical protein